jgi:hydrogenase expression/formation protein HypC
MCLAVPGRIVEITDTGDIAFRVGKVDFGGIRKDIRFAISVIDEDEAQRVFKVLEEMGAVQEEFGEIPQ